MRKRYDHKFINSIDEYDDKFDTLNLHGEKYTGLEQRKFLAALGYHFVQVCYTEQQFETDELNAGIYERRELLAIKGDVKVDLVPKFEFYKDEYTLIFKDELAKKFKKFILQ